MSINCNKCENMMAQALYSELGQKSQVRFDSHLQGCRQCTETFGQFRETLAVTDRRELAQADDETMKGFWDRLEPQLQQTAVVPIWNRLPSRIVLTDWVNRPAVVAAAALLLVAVGIFIGRINPEHAGGVPAQAATIVDPVLAAEFNEQFGSYLDRTKMILLGLDNYQIEDGATEGDLTRQRAISRELLHQGRDLKAHVAMASNEAVGLLIDDIERILMQLANSDEADIELTIEIIQAGMNHNGVLFKITLTELSRLHRDDQEVQPKTSSIFAFYEKEENDV